MQDRQANEKTAPPRLSKPVSLLPCKPPQRSPRCVPRCRAVACAAAKRGTVWKSLSCALIPPGLAGRHLSRVTPCRSPPCTLCLAVRDGKLADGESEGFRHGHAQADGGKKRIRGRRTCPAIVSGESSLLPYRGNRTRCRGARLRLPSLSCSLGRRAVRTQDQSSGTLTARISACKVEVTGCAREEARGFCIA